MKIQNGQLNNKLNQFDDKLNQFDDKLNQFDEQFNDIKKEIKKQGCNLDKRLNEIGTTLDKIELENEKEINKFELNKDDKVSSSGNDDKINKNMVLEDNSVDIGSDNEILMRVEAVSYTHLDVYKRQMYIFLRFDCYLTMEGRPFIVLSLIHI